MKLEKKTIPQLKKILWKHFSKYIRERDNFRCITCGKVGEGSGIHAGHFIPQSVGGEALRFDERNVFAQCYNCNINKGGWGERYAEVLECRFGREYIEKLRKIRDQERKQWTKEELIKLIEKYRCK